MKSKDKVVSQVLSITENEKYLLLWYEVIKIDPGEFWSRNVTVAKRSSKAK
jgi:hypothetical protein